MGGDGWLREGEGHVDGTERELPELVAVMLEGREDSIDYG